MISPSPPLNLIQTDKPAKVEKMAATISSSLLLNLHKPLISPQITSKSTSNVHYFTKPLNKKVMSPNPNHIVSASSSASSASTSDELIFFDGGAHYGDLLSNILLGFTLFWIPLTIAAVSRAFFLRYRFTNKRVTVISGFTGEDRTDFPYSAVTDVQVVPRLIGEWGDIIISLKDGTKVDLRSVPKFREIADYCLLMKEEENAGRGAGGARKGF